MHKIKRGEKIKCASRENLKRKRKKAISSARNAMPFQKRKNIYASPRR
jgi:hypothetical protein